MSERASVGARVRSSAGPSEPSSGWPRSIAWPRVMACVLAGVGAAAVMGTACSPLPVEESARPYPRTAPQFADSDTLDFLTLNIWHDQDWPARLELLASGIRAADPDVICLQEVLQQPGLPNQAMTLADRLGYSAHFVSWDSAGSEKRYGNAILTRTDVLERGERRLDPADDYRVIAHVRIAPERDTLDVYCTHLHHTQTEEGAETRRSQVLDALEYIDETREDGPVIFAGDFNAAVGAPELSPVRDRFGDAYGDLHADSADAVTTLNTDKGHRSARIDHVFYRSGPFMDLVPQWAGVVLDEPSPAGVWPSDHFGVLVRFELGRVGTQGLRRGTIR